MSEFVATALQNYNIPSWGEGFFDLDKDGDLVVVSQQNGQKIHHKLKQITSELVKDGATYPLLLRFSHLLRERFDRIVSAFETAMQQNNYNNHYTCVYPIKVNQQRAVVNELASHGHLKFGLESGSKPELLAVLGTAMPKQSMVICNGYKDREYIRTALIGQQMGRRVFIVIEKLHELSLVLEEADKMGIEPLLGVRVRMYAISKGNWQDTGGEKSKFGFSPSQLLKLIDLLAKAKKSHCLQLLHCHLGSQISSITDIRKGIKECSRYYAELNLLGINIKVIDVGGGLGVDYEGTQTLSFCSLNYSLQEYANTVVKTIAEVVHENQLSFPEIVTESGRALTAHHAVLITNLIDLESAPGLSLPEPADKNSESVIQNLWRYFQLIKEDTAIEAYHSATFYLNEALSLYTHSSLSLQDWARAEQLYFAICRKLYPLLNASIPGHEEVLNELNRKLADKLFCNFSLFQSLPDVWGVDQIFPVVPIQKLNQPLNKRGIIKDITCDSDGRIEKYVNGSSIEKSLLLPDCDQNDLLIGIFMVGAYQEILGGLHNLFGDTHSFHLDLAADGHYTQQEFASGDTVSEVLSIVHFEKEELLNMYRQQLATNSLNQSSQLDYLQELASGLEGYTYLEE